LIVAVVLAAGTSSRMGKPKQTLVLEGEPMLERVLRTLRQTKVDVTVVVLGAGAEEVRKKVRWGDEKLVVNHDYSNGMSESLKIGLKSVQEVADAALIVLADQPFVSSGTVDRVIDAYLKTKAAVVAPSYKGTRGNPVLFDKRLFPRIMGIKGDVGAKSVVEENRKDMLVVEVDDEGILQDIDTPADYERGSSKSKSRRTRGAS